MPKGEAGTGWDEVYRKTPLKDIPWEEGKPSSELVRLIESGVVEKGSALDICCGSANNAIYLARHGFDCFGIDISPTAIDYGHDKASMAGVTCQLHAGDAVHLTYPDSMFTLVFDRGCFHSIAPADREGFVKGLHRVMKPGSKYLLICFSASDRKAYAHAFSEKEIRGYFTPLFKVLSLKEIHGDDADKEHLFLSVLMEKTG